MWQLFIVLGIVVVILFILNWLIAWRHNETDMNRGLQRWQGWDDGHGS